MLHICDGRGTPGTSLGTTTCTPASLSPRRTCHSLETPSSFWRGLAEVLDLPVEVELVHHLAHPSLRDALDLIPISTTQPAAEGQDAPHSTSKCLGSENRLKASKSRSIILEPEIHKLSQIHQVMSTFCDPHGSTPSCCSFTATYTAQSQLFRSSSSACCPVSLMTAL